jgi:hypothetical protein
MTESRAGPTSSYNAPVTLPLPGGSPIFSTIQYKHLKKRVVHHSTARTITVICFVSGVLVFFFSSIYIGTTYLQEHLQDEKWGNSLGVRSLPNTRNKLSRWSKENLHVDLTDLGRPVVVQGTGADKSAFAREADAKDRDRDRARDRGRDRDGKKLHSGARDSKHDSADAAAALSARREDDNTPLSRIKKKLATTTAAVPHAEPETATATTESTAVTDTLEVAEEQGQAGGQQKQAASSLRGGVLAEVTQPAQPGLGTNSAASSGGSGGSGLKTAAAARKTINKGVLAKIRDLRKINIKKSGGSS